MTDDNVLERYTGESSRRTFIKTSALASATAVLGLSGVGGVAGQDGGQQIVGLIPQGQFISGARFQIVSEAIPFAPIENDAEGREYTTRVISYQFSPGLAHMLFVPEGANLQQGQTYQFQPEFDPVFDDRQEFGPGVDEGAIDQDVTFENPAELGLIAVRFSAVQGGGQQGGQTTTPGNQTATGNQTTTEDGTGN